MKQSERVIEFIEGFCTLGESYLGKPFEVLPFQRDIIEKIYQEDDEGKRLIRQAVITMPRKNAKTTLVAALCVYHLIADDTDKAPLVVAAAGDRAQARLVHDAIKTMIQGSPELSSVCTVYRNEIKCHRNKGVARVVSADAGLQLGMNPSLVVVDEYLVHKTSDLYDALTLGSATRNQPLSIVISTAGYDLESPLGKLVRYGRKVESGEISDPNFAYINYGPKENEEFDADSPEVWARFNPAWDHFLNHEEFESAHKRTARAAFIRFRLNGWTTTADHWLPQGAIEKCEVDRKIEKGERIVLGFDGGWGGDSTALVACTLDQEVPKHLELIGCWEKPDDEHAQGWRTPVHEVEATIRQAFEDYNVAALVADPWRWEQSLMTLAEEGYPVIEFPTGSVQRMTQGTQALYDAIIDRQVTHNGDPQLLRHFLNCHLHEDSRGARIRKDKRGSTKKIDIAVASLIAYHSAMTWKDEVSAESQLLVF